MTSFIDALENAAYQKALKIMENKIITPISVGELIDKITILEIKLLFIKEEEKLVHVKKELEKLLFIYGNEQLFPAEIKKEIELLKQNLLEVNTDLWKIEDDIRDKELKKEFDAAFIELARSVYFTNDKRFEIKNKITKLLNSDIQEVKSYQNYGQNPPGI